jgi:hypothetical protein
LPAANNTYSEIYWEPCGHPSNLLTVRHLFRSALRSLCSEGELSRLFLIVHRRIPSGALLWRSSQLGISIWTIFVYLGLMSLYSGPCPVSTSSRIGHMSWLFSCSIFRPAAPQPTATTVTIPRTCSTSA